VSNPSSIKKRFPWIRIVLQIEQILVFVGIVLYAILVATKQEVSLWVMMLAILTVGNLVIPLAFAARRIFFPRPFSLNWVFFFPVQIGF